MSIFYKSRLAKGRNILLLLMFAEILVELGAAFVAYYHPPANMTYEKWLIYSIPRVSISIFLWLFLYKGRIWARNITIAKIAISIIYITFSIPAITKLPFLLALINIVTYTILIIVLLALLTSRGLRHFFDYQRISSRSTHGELNEKGKPLFSYDIAISFAGEDRKIAKKLSDKLIDNGLSVFYDKDEQSDLIGKDLYQYLQSVYRDKAKYCVIIVSKNYVRKKWTRHELHNAQARAFKQWEEYLIPVIIENVDVPGLNETIGHYDLSSGNLSELARILTLKVLNSQNVAALSKA